MNNREKKIIVSLTSYPARIETVNKTIKTLLNQSLKADEIILWLSPEEFSNREKDLPSQLLELQNKGLTIDWYHNIGPYKKLIPTLIKHPNDIIVTADDDVLYDKDWLKFLYESYLQNPKMIHCHRAHKILLKNGKIKSYKQWFKCKYLYRGESAFSIFFTGVGGVLYPPNTLSKNVLNEKEFLELCYNTDDIWFWSNAVLNNVQIKFISNALIDQEKICGTQNIGLWKENQLKNNDININNVIKKYPTIIKTLEKESKTIKYKIYSVSDYIKYKIKRILGK